MEEGEQAAPTACRVNVTGPWWPEECVCMEALSLGNKRSEQKGLALCPPVGVADQGAALFSPCQPGQGGPRLSWEAAPGSRGKADRNILNLYLRYNILGNYNTVGYVCREQGKILFCVLDGGAQDSESKAGG